MTKAADHRGLFWGPILVGALVLALLFVMGCRLGFSLRDAEHPDVSAKVAAIVAPALPQGTLDGAPAGAGNGTVVLQPPVPQLPRVEAEEGRVSFHFAPDEARLPDDAANAVGEIVKGVAAGRLAVVTVYPGPADDPAAGEALAFHRAGMVHDLLILLGIGYERIAMPAATAPVVQGTADAEAGRVDVTLDDAPTH